uniref:Uncharacterized protein n=1 Tax=Romanomermis culicivorax TaxID=13658 RepID=A0A915HL76_ROMCU
MWNYTCFVVAFQEKADRAKNCDFWEDLKHRRQEKRNKEDKDRKFTKHFTLKSASSLSNCDCEKPLGTVETLLSSCLPFESSTIGQWSFSNWNSPSSTIGTTTGAAFTGAGALTDGGPATGDAFSIGGDLALTVGAVCTCGRRIYVGGAKIPR